MLPRSQNFIYPGDNSMTMMMIIIAITQFAFSIDLSIPLSRFQSLLNIPSFDFRRWPKDPLSAS